MKQGLLRPEAAAEVLTNTANNIKVALGGADQGRVDAIAQTYEQLSVALAPAPDGVLARDPERH